MTLVIYRQLSCEFNYRINFTVTLDTNEKGIHTHPYVRFLLVFRGDRNN